MKQITKVFLKGDSPTLSNFYLVNFDYTFQWLLSNISDFTTRTQQVMDKVCNRSMNNV